MKSGYVYITAPGAPDTVIMGMVAVAPSWGLVLTLILAGVFKKNAHVVVCAPCVVPKQDK